MMINSRYSLRAARRLGAALIVAHCAFAFVPALRAQETVVSFDPAQTKIDFTLGATLHTVHGTFKLKSGEIRFDASTGKASGAVIVDATSGETGNGGRDRKMHREILESAKFPEIVFTPSQVKGPPDWKGLTQGGLQGTSQVEVSGAFRLHGQDHEMTLVVSIQTAAGGQLQASTRFSVPYIQWGLKNPSTFILRVSETVDLDIHAAARIGPALASQ
jgi:polyisoprenoid-binding protein YceI